MLPNELLFKRNWVGVKSGSKVPLSLPTMNYASSTNPDTWCDYTTAYGCVYKGMCKYLGFVFDDSGIVGIDIDKGFDEDGMLSDLAVDIISRCQSYTELSRSGRGVHILVKGTIPFLGANNQNGVEIYRSGRYFIMTGRQIIFNDIVENQDALDYVVSRYFPTTPTKKNIDVGVRDVIYSPVRKFEKGKVTTTYPPINEGSRHLCLLSLAGQYRGAGADEKEIYTTLQYVNKTACFPPVDDKELKSIVRSIMKYDNNR